MLIDIEGGYAICSMGWVEECNSITVTNNIAAGVMYSGFLVPAHGCGQEDS